MLKYERSDDKCELEMEGNVLEICADVTFMIREVYQGITKDEPEVAKAFRDMVIRVVSDPEGPVWTDPKNAVRQLIQKLEKLVETP
jgi:hypothetical protein